MQQYIFQYHIETGFLNFVNRSFSHLKFFIVILVLTSLTNMLPLTMKLFGDCMNKINHTKPLWKFVSGVRKLSYNTSMAHVNSNEEILL